MIPHASTLHMTIHQTSCPIIKDTSPRVNTISLPKLPSDSDLNLHIHVTLLLHKQCPTSLALECPQQPMRRQYSMPKKLLLHSSMLFSKRFSVVSSPQSSQAPINPICPTHPAISLLTRPLLLSKPAYHETSSSKPQTYCPSSTVTGRKTDFSPDSSIAFDRFRSLDVTWHYIFWLGIYASIISGTSILGFAVLLVLVAVSLS